MAQAQRGSGLDAGEDLLVHVGLRGVGDEQNDLRIEGFKYINSIE